MDHKIKPGWGGIDPSQGRHFEKMPEQRLAKKKKKMAGSSKYVWLLDPGHGGIIDGIYQTEGKRSPRWRDQGIDMDQLFEGEFNRAIVKRIKKMCDLSGIDAIDIVSGSQKDIPLSDRTDRANMITKKEKQTTNRKTIYVSIHADAFEKESAHGWSVFTSPGETSSDKVAQVFYEKMKEALPSMRFRTDNTDGDADKEAKFWVLKKTIGAAILTENFFMTNQNECRLLLSEDFRDQIAEAHFDAILTIEKEQLI